MGREINCKENIDQSDMIRNLVQGSSSSNGKENNIFEYIHIKCQTFNVSPPSAYRILLKPFENVSLYTVGNSNLAM